MADQWSQAFLKKLNIIQLGFFIKLIIDKDFKFLSKFQIILFEMLEIKLFYSIIYYS